MVDYLHILSCEHLIGSYIDLENDKNISYVSKLVYVTFFFYYKVIKSRSYFREIVHT